MFNRDLNIDLPVGREYLFVAVKWKKKIAYIWVSDERLIKMDYRRGGNGGIEEARNVICSQKPNLAIAMYHKRKCNIYFTVGDGV